MALLMDLELTSSAMRPEFVGILQAHALLHGAAEL